MPRLSHLDFYHPNNIGWGVHFTNDLNTFCEFSKHFINITCEREGCLTLGTVLYCGLYRGADKSLARPTSQCILFDGENISFDASLVILVHINSTNIPPIMIINGIYES